MTKFADDNSGTRRMKRGLSIDRDKLPLNTFILI